MLAHAFPLSTVRSFWQVVVALAPEVCDFLLDMYWVRLTHSLSCSSLCYFRIWESTGQAHFPVSRSIGQEVESIGLPDSGLECYNAEVWL